ncbi:MAG: diphosphomevalonate decarboxylase [Calditrichaeota bacterium]|nr:MAG: diphosphomevalonate decarboxylase [Calditrichota bacterium]MBL1206851.1 diphosphomevalonate decarboxylase [Calditrichota bacterium]NOG46678.1 diphosphomevalonate decarboxylase [Calditrichota bacterium]
MKKVKAKAHSNIALVKYWGKRNIPLNLPAVASISITLDTLFTETLLMFDPELEKDTLVLNKTLASEKDTKRMSKFLDLIRSESNEKNYAYVESENNFPTSAGLASSASSFACLTMAAANAANLDISKSRLSEFARLGSGSAARSIFGGFVEMDLGKKEDGSDSIAHQIFPKEHWDLSVLIAITSEKKKKTGSTEGMEASRLTSPFYQPWIDSSTKDMNEMRDAITQKDFEKVAEVSEFSCLKMHALALATNPGLIYWNGATVDAMHYVREMRESGIPVFFTIDAGPQVKAICPTKYAGQVKQKLEQLPDVIRVIKTGLGGDAIILEEKVVS